MYFHMVCFTTLSQVEIGKINRTFLCFGDWLNSEFGQRVDHLVTCRVYG